MYMGWGGRGCNMQHVAHEETENCKQQLGVAVEVSDGLIIKCVL